MWNPDCSAPVSPSHTDHLFHSCDIFLLVFFADHHIIKISVTCPWGKVRLPFGYWGEGGWKVLQPSWCQPLLETWIFSWCGSYLGLAHGSLEHGSHLGLSLKVILSIAVEQICKISFQETSMHGLIKRRIQLSQQTVWRTTTTLSVEFSFCRHPHCAVYLWTNYKSARALRPSVLKWIDSCRDLRKMWHFHNWLG